MGKNRTMIFGLNDGTSSSSELPRATC